MIKTEEEIMRETAINMKVSKAQQLAISILVSNEDSSVIECYDHRTGHSDFISISDGWDDLTLHHKTFKWLLDNELLHKSIHPTMYVDVYYPTAKCKQVAAELNIKPYSQP